MMKTQIDEQVDNFQLVGPWYNCSNENVAYFVLYISQKVKNNPD